MTTIVLAVRAGYWRRPVALLRKALAVLRERRAEYVRCATLAAAYRALPAADRLTAGVHTSHRSPRKRVARRTATPRAPRGPRHTPGPGRVRVVLPDGWRTRLEMSHRWSGGSLLSVAELLAGV